jgi:hypothetical protein
MAGSAIHPYFALDLAEANDADVGISCLPGNRHFTAF